MVTTPIQLNSISYTLVLDGEGFVFAPQETEYLFADIEPSGAGMIIPPGSQFRGTALQKLWARSVGFATSDVFANPEV